MTLTNPIEQKSSLQLIQELDDAGKQRLIDSMGMKKISAIMKDPVFRLRPKQKMMWDSKTADGNRWRYRLMFGSRSIGKNEAGKVAIYEAVTRMGYKHLAIVVQTYDDIEKTIAGRGPTSLLSLPLKINYKGRPPTLYFPEYDATVLIYSAKNPDSIRGLSAEFVWCDEWAAWYTPKPSTDGSPTMDAFDNLEFAVREKDPRMLITTTPRGTKRMRAMIRDPYCLATHEVLYANKDNLGEGYIKRMEEIYEGTRIGRQELGGEVLDDIEGALWKEELIEDAQVEVESINVASWIRACDKITIAVDPAMREGIDNDATAIVIAGRINNKAYILESKAMRAQPPVWASEINSLQDKWGAQRVLIEDNQGGDSMEYILNQAGVTNVKRVRAIKDKETRATPAHALYEQRRVKHVTDSNTDHIKLEDELSYFPIGGYGTHDDLVDAMVYAVTDLLTTSPPRFIGNVFD